MANAADLSEAMDQARAVREAADQVAASASELFAHLAAMSVAAYEASRR